MNVDLSIEVFKNLSDHNVISAALKISSVVYENGGRAYFVGGCVRDAILGHEVTDFDIEVFGIDFCALKSLLEKYFDVDETGRSFCVLKIGGLPIDVSVPRSERKLGDSHRAFEVRQLKTFDVRAAADRRDFTINSIYFDVHDEKLIDEFGGMKDLRHGILRHVSEKFSEDPLRVLRGMQFAGRFELKCDKETLNICCELSIENISKERIFSEWEKLILKSKKPSFGLKFLMDSGWLKFFPEIDILRECHQDISQHPEDTVFEHTCLAMDVFAETKIGNPYEDLVLGFATLCHDFGKPYVTTKDKYGIHHYGHDEAGILPAKNFLMQINVPRGIIDDVLPLVRYHMLPRTMFQNRGNNSVSDVLHLANNVGRIDRLLRLCYNDCVGRKDFLKNYDSRPDDWLMNISKSLGVFEKKPKQIIQGNDLLSIGLTPSDKFSKIINSCFEAQLDGKFSTHSEGMEFLQKIAENYM